MNEQEIRQALAKAESEFIDRMVDVLRRVMTEAYMKGLKDGSDLKHDNGPMVKLKPEAYLKRKVKMKDFIGCRNKTRIINQLTAHYIDTYGDLAQLTAEDVWAWRNFGKGCFEELKQVMKMNNVEFRKV